MKHLLIILLSFITLTSYSQYRYRNTSPGYIIQAPRVVIAPPCNHPCGPQVVYVRTWHYETVLQPVVDFWGRYVRDRYGRIVYERVRIKVYD
jgi:hypothetical protein